jgi:hypothetical protein
VATVTFEQLPERLRQIGREYEAGASVVVQLAAQTADQGLVESTPIDTGEAVSNWVGTLNAPFGGVIPAFAPAPKGSGGAGVRSINQHAARAQAQAVIRTFDVRRHKAIFLTNNARHIAELNRGHSGQAPAGFVQTAVQVAILRVRAIRSVLVLGRKRGAR